MNAHFPPFATVKSTGAAPAAPCSPTGTPPAPPLPTFAVLDVQIGGDHYKGLAIQPAVFSTRNGLGFLEGCIVKRAARHDKPTGKGREDIEKLIHEAQLILELHYPKEPT